MNILDTLGSNPSLPPEAIIPNPKYFDVNFLLDKIVQFFTFSGSVEFTKVLNDSKILSFIYILFAILSTFLIFVITYSIVRIFEIRKREHHHIEEEIHEYIHKHAHDGDVQKSKVKNQRWAQVLEYLTSQSEGDWRLSILEADSMLEDLLEQRGFKGENLGEKLKNTNNQAFHNLSSAWEVHIIRNKIAHDGASFQMSLHEAKRVIALYETIFKEFDLI